VSVIQIEGLRKEFRRRRGARSVALSELDLEVPEGGVFAFLGPNGAGKTTTLRCLLGLIRPNSGHIRMLGVAVPSRLPDIVGDVGSVLETPTFHPRLGGRDNLLLLGRLAGRDARAVDVVLEQVGLGNRSRDRVSTYSLGMRQRLAIGAALLKDPQLLVLDEPMNALDPAGLVHMRNLLRDLAADGRTVFMSSHLLAEIDVLADRVAIVRDGRCVYSGATRDLLMEHDSGHVFVRIDDMASAASVLTESGLSIQRRDGMLLVTGASDSAQVGERLASRGLFPSELGVVRPDLESVFLELTAEEAGAEC
jgi:ABC-2 type transport system ATP-binding protein